jgi:hypothetical protein
MKMAVHPLQENSVKLLLSLYQDLHLPVTSAMLSVLNSYYPAIEDILKTLDHYKELPKVAEFEKDNELVILSAKESLKQVVTAENANSSEGNSDNSLLDFEFVKAYSALKAISLEDIEKAFSKALSEVCNEDLLVEINSIRKSEDALNSNADMTLSIKPSTLIRS